MSNFRLSAEGSTSISLTGLIYEGEVHTSDFTDDIEDGVEVNISCDRTDTCSCSRVEVPIIQDGFCEAVFDDGSTPSGIGIRFVLVAVTDG